MAATIHQVSRAAIMRRAWQLARQRREESARQVFDLGARIVGARVIHARSFDECLAATKLDLGAAQKLAWREAKGVLSLEQTFGQRGALVHWRRNSSSVAPLRRRLGRVLPLLARFARWIDVRFIRRAA